MRRGKRRPRQKLVDDCDKMFGALVRADGQCLRCGKRDKLQCAHGFSRRYRSTRWDFRNAFCLCQGCHLYFTMRPLEWDDWLISRWGQARYDLMRARALSTDKPDMDLIAKVLTEQYDELPMREVLA